jgi:hypothetical protein
LFFKLNNKVRTSKLISLALITLLAANIFIFNNPEVAGETSQKVLMYEDGGEGEIAADFSRVKVTMLV